MSSIIRMSPARLPPNGWKAVQEAINHVKQYFGGEAWVLGDRNYSSLDPLQLQPQLRERYHKDFIANWRAYLANSEVARYRSVPDAAAKLKQLSSNESYLLKLFCLASVNVSAAGDDPASAPYQPILWVTPANCMDHYVSEHNSPYLSALIALQTSVNQVAQCRPKRQRRNGHADPNGRDQRLSRHPPDRAEFPHRSRG